MKSVSCSQFKAIVMAHFGIWTMTHVMSKRSTRRTVIFKNPSLFCSHLITLFLSTHSHFFMLKKYSNFRLGKYVYDNLFL